MIGRAASKLTGSPVRVTRGARRSTLDQIVPDPPVKGSPGEARPGFGVPKSKSLIGRRFRSSHTGHHFKIVMSRG
jgi:hypothetical protein